MVTTPQNFAVDAALRARINATLATPRFKIGELLKLTTPPINREIFNDWRKRGHLALDLQAAIGTGAELRAVADLLGPPRSTVHTFTGGDCLKTLTLHALSSCGIGFASVPEIHRQVVQRAMALMIEPELPRRVLNIYRRDGETIVEPAEAPDWTPATADHEPIFAFVRLRVDDMIWRWLHGNVIEAPPRD